MYLLRTRFGKDIVAEFLPPLRKTKTDKVIIFCDGQPGLPGKTNLAEFYSKKGYWFINPRYKGAWESGGQFLNRSPHLDIKEVIEEISKGIKDFWSGETYRIKPKKIILIGHSFGGPAAILLSSDPRVSKVIGLSPVTDWRVKSKTESLDWVFTFTKLAFGNGYRINKQNWNKLKNGKFYNPAKNLNLVDGSKILIIHAKDDEIVPVKQIAAFEKQTKAKLKLYKTGGHFSSKILTTTNISKIVDKHLKD